MGDELYGVRAQRIVNVIPDQVEKRCEKDEKYEWLEPANHILV
jgi:hypothetical protein